MSKLRVVAAVGSTILSLSWICRCRRIWAFSLVLSWTWWWSLASGSHSKYMFVRCGFFCPLNCYFECFHSFRDLYNICRRLFTSWLLVDSFRCIVVFFCFFFFICRYAFFYILNCLVSTWVVVFWKRVSETFLRTQKRSREFSLSWFLALMLTCVCTVMHEKLVLWILVFVCVCVVVIKYIIALFYFPWVIIDLIL